VWLAVRLEGEGQDAVISQAERKGHPFGISARKRKKGKAQSQHYENAKGKIKFKGAAVLFREKNARSLEI